MTPTSAETKAALEIETEIRLFHIIFWITDSYLKGQRDMSLGKTICHDTMPMYRPESPPHRPGGRTPAARGVKDESFSLPTRYQSPTAVLRGCQLPQKQRKRQRGNNVAIYQEVICKNKQGRA